MPYNNNQALVREVRSAANDINPSIHGLNYLTDLSLSAPLKAEVRKEITILERRRNLSQDFIALVHAATNAYNALIDDGYPVLDKVILEWSLFQELKRVSINLGIAIDVFNPDPNRPVAIGLDLNSAVDVPQQRPRV